MVNTHSWCVMNKLGLTFGTALFVIAVCVAPIPLAITLSNPTRQVVLYPNVLFGVPLILSSALLLLYGVTTDQKSV